MTPELVILSTGNELVSGNSVDTNSTWISAKLFPLGIKTVAIKILPDIPEIIELEIKHLVNSSKSTLVIMTGGMGPTEDDYTLAVMKKFTNGKIFQVKKSFIKLENLVKMNKISEKVFNMAVRQTYIPEQAIYLENENGIAPGFIIEKEFVTLICLPGVPIEMKSMLEDEVIPYINKKYNLTKNYYDFRLLWELNEADFQLGFIENNKTLIEQGISWGVAPKSGYLRVSFQSDNDNLIKKIVQNLENYYDGRITKDVFSELPKRMINQNITIATAESCTGGLIAKMLTDVPGSSSYFIGSIVAYHNKVKELELDVPEELLDAHGAVSREVALAMVNGLAKKMQTDISIAVTGIAGPGGETENKKIGLVYIAIKLKGMNAEVHSFQFSGNRERIRELTANFAYYLIIKKI